MGIDINLVVEVRAYDGAAWGKIPRRLYDHHTLTDRWYYAYAVLGGIKRRSFPAPVPIITPPRGLPPDYPYDLGDYGFGWVTLAELLAYDWDQPYAGDTLREYVDEWLTGLESVRAWAASAVHEPEDVRLVFGFDG